MTAQDNTESALALAYLPATRRQQRVVVAVALLLLAAFGLAAPFGANKLPQFVSFNPSVQSIVFVNDLITAVFLFAQYAISRSRAILALAAGYFYTALICIPYTLSNPGAFPGLLNAGPQSSAWLYFFWINGIPLGTIAYALLITADRTARSASSRKASSGLAISFCALCVTVLVFAIAWVITTQGWLLPPMTDGDRYTYVVTFIWAPLSILLTLVAIALLWFLGRSVLDLWLMLVMLSLLLNHVIADFFGGARYSLGFYASRGFTVVTSILVLILLMKEITNLYVRLANSNLVLARERNNKLMNVGVTAAAIAHELKQPLAAMVANADASLGFLEQTPPDVRQAKEALNDIVDDGHHTGDALDGIRNLFRSVNQSRESVDVNELVLEVLHTMRGELNASSVVARAELTSDLPPIQGNRGQLQQVIFNLAHNAVEAMASTQTQDRTLRLITQRGDQDRIVVAVQDSGPGIEPTRLDQIFDAFVTTKTQGIGLGLAICRVIVERHGGQLTAFSDGKNGALFQFVLPTNLSTDAAFQT